MKRVFLTGGTGALGTELRARLARHPDIRDVVLLSRRGSMRPEHLGEMVVRGDVRAERLGLSEKLLTQPQFIRGFDAVIHAAADTRFNGDEQELHAANVKGTRNTLAFAGANLKPGGRFIHLSTTCVAGDRTGRVPEAPLEAPGRFLNAYEKSKWAAEQTVAESPVPADIVRVAIAAGRATDGGIEREGAIHHMLRWICGGLIPMIPVAEGATLDIVTTDAVADVVLALVEGKGERAGGFYHVSQGEAAPAIDELVNAVTAEFSRRDAAWARGALKPPVLADARTFELFRRSVELSGDAIFSRILQQTGAFLPALLYPKTCETAAARRLTGSSKPGGDWRELLPRVIDSLDKTEKSPEPSRLILTKLQCKASA